MSSVIKGNKLGTNAKEKTDPSPTTTKPLSKFQQFKKNNLLAINKKASDENTNLKRLIKKSRASGSLYLNNFNLGEIPLSILRINIDKCKEEGNDDDEGDNDDEKFKWWQQVDLQKLSLSSNKIKSIPKEIEFLDTLLLFDAHDNEINFIDENINRLSKLENFNISHNQLPMLPESVANLKSLLVLNLSHNQLTSLPKQIGSLDYLEDLNASNNLLVEIPKSFGYLTRLRTLNLSVNKIKTLFPETVYSQNLRLIDLSDNQIEIVPKEIGTLVNLEQLYVHKNRIKEFPIFDKCCLLKDLDFSFNQIKDFGKDAFKNMPALVNLNLRDNKIANVHREICDLTKLERLDLSNNDLFSVPNELALLENLKQLSLIGNPIRNLRKDILSRGTDAILKSLRMHIELPEPDEDNTYAIRTDLIKVSKTFDYSGRKAQELPINYRELILKNTASVLNISKNQIQRLPYDFDCLADCLTCLVYSFNNLTSLPTELFSLRCLNTLDLRGNQLMAIQDDIKQLDSLRELIIADNKFTEIPASVFDLKKLENFFADGNRIQTIDVSRLANLKCLSTLNLQNNEISKIPPELGLCTHLRSLHLEGNPFRIPNHQIVAKGTNAILEYLRGRIATT